MELSAAQQAQTDAQREIGAREEAAQREAQVQQRDALMEAFPAWNDPVVARKEILELQEYAIKMGVPEQAARANVDPFTFKLTQKAMLYDRAQAAKTAAVTKDPPRVIKPGTPNANPNKDGSNGERRQTQLAKLTRSGDLEDARGLLRL